MKIKKASLKTEFLSGRQLKNSRQKHIFKTLTKKASICARNKIKIPKRTEQQLPYELFAVEFVNNSKIVLDLL